MGGVEKRGTLFKVTGKGERDAFKWGGGSGKGWKGSLWSGAREKREAQVGGCLDRGWKLNLKVENLKGQKNVEESW